jgi:hypothetical protein
VTAGNSRAGQAASHIAAVQVPGKVIFLNIMNINKSSFIPCC